MYKFNATEYGNKFLSTLIGLEGGVFEPEYVGTKISFTLVDGEIKAILDTNNLSNLIDPEVVFSSNDFIVKVNDIIVNGNGVVQVIESATTLVDSDIYELIGVIRHENPILAHTIVGAAKKSVKMKK